MSRVRGDGITLQTALWPGTGRDLLCLHGLTANCRSFDRIARLLAPAHRITVVDLRGRGRSDKPPPGAYGFDRHIGDIRCLLEAQFDGKVVLAGHSLGAYIALGVAASCPDRIEALVLLDGGASLSQLQWDQVEAAIRPSIDRLEKIYACFDAYLAPLKQVPFLQPWSPFLDTYFAYETERTPGGIRSRTPLQPIRQEAAEVRRIDMSVLYPRIRCPVLILRAPRGLLSQADLLLPEPALNRMRQALARNHRVDVPEANHFSILFGDHPERDRALLAFLESLPR